MTAARLSVLLVADDGALADGLAPALASRGHEVTAARSTPEALGEPDHDVVVADLALAGGRGLALLDALLGALSRRRKERPHVVVLADRGDLAECRGAMRLGATDFLTKPVTSRELVAAVERCGPARRRAARLERRYAAGREVVDRGARDVSAFALRCGVGPTARGRIAAATAEALENAYRHAYLCRPGPVEVQADVDARSVRVTVRDEGVGFDAAAALEALDDCAAGGLARACALAEDLRVESARGRGTYVRLRFDVVRALFDDDGCFDLTELDWFTPETSRMVLSTLGRGDDDNPYRFSPALAVTLGRLLAGPDPQRFLQTALWS